MQQLNKTVCEKLDLIKNLLNILYDVTDFDEREHFVDVQPQI